MYNIIALTKKLSKQLEFWMLESYSHAQLYVAKNRQPLVVSLIFQKNAKGSFKTIIA